MSVLTNDYISPAEAARRLNVSSESVRRWIASGELRGVGLGGGTNARYRISTAELETFVRAASDEPEAARTAPHDPTGPSPMKGTDEQPRKPAEPRRRMGAHPGRRDR